MVNIKFDVRHAGETYAHTYGRYRDGGPDVDLQKS